MKAVPFVRLDKIDQVEELFEHAIEFLEQNLEEPALGSDSEGSKNREGTKIPGEHHSFKGSSEEEGAGEVIPKVAHNLTRDYSSPTLGRRRIGERTAKPSSRAVTGGEGAGSKHSSRATSRSRAPGNDSSDDETIEAEKPKLTLAKSAGNMNMSEKLRIGAVFTRDYSSPSLAKRRIESQVPNLKSTELADPHVVRDDTPADVTASPQQHRMSLQLLKLASAKAEERPSTPKPGFLRRLDSPDSPHGKLVIQRTNLAKSLRRALSLVGSVKPAALEDVKARFKHAVDELEHATALEVERSA